MPREGVCPEGSVLLGVTAKGSLPRRGLLGGGGLPRGCVCPDTPQ